MRIVLDPDDLQPLAAQYSAILVLLQNLERRLDAMAQLNQQQIDVLANRIAAVSDSLAGAATTILDAISGVRADIDALKAQIPPEVDTTSLDGNLAGLEAAVQPLQAGVSNLQELDAENPEPGPPPPTP